MSALDIRSRVVVVSSDRYGYGSVVWRFAPSSPRSFVDSSRYIRISCGLGAGSCDMKIMAFTSRMVMMIVLMAMMTKHLDLSFFFAFVGPWSVSSKCLARPKRRPERPSRRCRRSTPSSAFRSARRRRQKRRSGRRGPPGLPKLRKRCVCVSFLFRV